MVGRRQIARLDLEPLAAQRFQLGGVQLLNQPPLVDDPNTRRQTIDFGQNMARHKDRHTPLLRIGRTLAARVETPSARQAIRLDVTQAAQDTVGARLGLRVRMARGGDDTAWLLASPESLDETLRPRIELLLR